MEPPLPPSSGEEFDDNPSFGANSGPEWSETVPKEMVVELHDALAIVFGMGGPATASRLEQVIEATHPCRLADISFAVLPATPLQKLEWLAAVAPTMRVQAAIDALRRHAKRNAPAAPVLRSLRALLPAIDANGKPVVRSPGGERGEQSSQVRSRPVPPEVQKVLDRLEEARLPEAASDAVADSVRRLQRIRPSAPEFDVILSHLSFVADLPWSTDSGAAERPVSLAAMQAVLDEDHDGLAQVKGRVLEFAAVLEMQRAQGERTSVRAPILCLVGPPGTGKTSLGKSIARALGRPFERLALGGVGDEAELRGHRRTYIGAMPGKILSAMKKVGVRDPVLMLDEVDKLGRDWRGDPTGALLEILDPEQNHTFTDNYLGIPFDLSAVTFICTVNDLSKVSGPLRDRLEVVELDGYLEHEKVRIAQRHLVPRQRARHGLEGEAAFAVLDDALHFLVSQYTVEAGVRGLERRIASLCRAAVAQQVRATQDPDAPRSLTMPLDRDAVVAVLGEPTFADTDKFLLTRLNQPGFAIGLAWTSAGGKVMVVEVSSSLRGDDDRLHITGNLGKVMQESVNTVFSWVRANAARLRLPAKRNLMQSHVFHVHAPSGAAPKDGPSAGIAIAVALVSWLTGVKPRTDTAMTGELSLHGTVLPIGGERAKVLAAHDAGIRRVILPAFNVQVLRSPKSKVPAQVLREVELLPVESIDQALRHAFDESPFDRELGMILRSAL
jgi:ATP-dependent Lon protease